MNTRDNARLTPRGRELLVGKILRGQWVDAAAWGGRRMPANGAQVVARFIAEGIDGLKDRSSLHLDQTRRVTTDRATNTPSPGWLNCRQTSIL